MNNDPIIKLFKLKELLAALEHERWADWQKYCHNIIRGTIATGGSLEEVLSRWDRQIVTPYMALTEEEKQSDREQVDRYWPLIQAWGNDLVASKHLANTDSSKLSMFISVIYNRWYNHSMGKKKFLQNPPKSLKGQKCELCGSTAIDHTEMHCSMNRLTHA